MRRAVLRLFLFISTPAHVEGTGVRICRTFADEKHSEFLQLLKPESQDRLHMVVATFSHIADLINTLYFLYNMCNFSGYF